MANVPALFVAHEKATTTPGIAGWLLSGLLTAELFGQLFLSTDLSRAIVVTTLAAICCLVLLAGSQLSISRWFIGRQPGPLLAGLGFAAVGVYGGLLGLANRNGPYYLAADLYHWFGEGLLAAVLTVALAYAMDGRQLSALLAWSGLALGLLALLAAAAGSLGFPVAGGHVIPALHIWRLEGGRGFPIVLLLFVTAILWKGRPQGMERLMARLAWCILFLALILTFKRAQWLTYGVLFVWIATPSRWRWHARIAAVVSAALVAAALLASPLDVVEGPQYVLDQLTYNPNYTTEESLGDRAAQLSTVLPEVVERPFGSGFGATTYAYTPRFNEHIETHYVHNAYLYYALQVGIPGVLAALLLLALLVVALWRRSSLDLEWNWLAYGAMASVTAFAVMGLTEVSFHTEFFGFSLGLGILALFHTRVDGFVSGHVRRGRP